MKKIAVYGSLRDGMYNNRLLSGSNRVSSETIEAPFDMIDMGAFPGLVASEEPRKIKIEVFEVDDPTYARVERLEGYPRFYDRTPVKTSVGDADIYFLHKDDHYSKLNLVNKFEDDEYDWVKHLEKKHN